MTVEYSVISIGTLSHNRLWGESGAVRTAHATTTLVTSGDRSIIVDPSLPAAALQARFGERTGQDLASVTDVFCTTLRPVHRRALEALRHARWWCGEVELHNYRQRLSETLEAADRLKAEDVQALQADVALLERFQPAPDELAPQVQFYPLYGPSPGGAGLLLTPATNTVIVAGDAALTAEHVDRGQIWEGASDPETAMESLRELLELADVIIPGHDNAMLFPRRNWL